MVTSIFLVAPEPEILPVFESTFVKLHLNYQLVTSLEELIRKAPPHSLAFLPLAKEGVKSLSDVRAQRPSLEAVALADTGVTSEALEVMRRGALDYLQEPLEEENIIQSVRRWQDKVAEMSDAANLSKIIMLMELGRTLTSTLRLEELYDQIIEQVQRAFRPDTVSLMLLTSLHKLRLVAQRGLSNKAIPGTQVSLTQGIAGKVVQEGRPLLLLGGLEGTEFERIARSKNQIASSMSIPLQIQGKTLGVLNVNRYQGRANYTETDANLLHIFAAQIAISIQNAQLFSQLREENDRIIEAQERVRRELARDLHDGLTQVLATLVINVDYLRSIIHPGAIVPEGIEEDLSFLRTAARQAIQDARTMTFGMRPLVLETKGLVAALDRYLDTVRESDRTTDYHLNHTGCLNRPWLAPNVARMVFAILQEAINNARKHAQAKNLWVTLYCQNKAREDYLLKAIVRDDGLGFDMSQIEGSYDERMSFGLHNMKERAKLIEGILQMDSSPKGTVVELVIPWREWALFDK